MWDLAFGAAIITMMAGFWLMERKRTVQLRQESLFLREQLEIQHDAYEAQLHEWKQRHRRLLGYLLEEGSYGRYRVSRKNHR
jgi:hypothetical protein